MGTWIAFTQNGVVPCGTLHFSRLDGRFGRIRLYDEAIKLLQNRSKSYNGAIVYKGRISDYDNQNKIIFTL